MSVVNINDNINAVRGAYAGLEVRDSIAGGLQAMQDSINDNLSADALNNIIINGKTSVQNAVMVTQNQATKLLTTQTAFDIPLTDSKVLYNYGEPHNPFICDGHLCWQQKTFTETVNDIVYYKHNFIDSLTHELKIGESTLSVIRTPEYKTNGEQSGWRYTYYNNDVEINHSAGGLYDTNYGFYLEGYVVKMTSSDVPASCARSGGNWSPIMFKSIKQDRTLDISYENQTWGNTSLQSFLMSTAEYNYYLNLTSKVTMPISYGGNND